VSLCTFSFTLVISNAGFDPQPGRVLTDIKTFEQHRVYGFAIMRLLILFKPKINLLSIQWTDIAFVLRSERTIQKHPIKAVKIGIVPH
jgi:hydroxymethylpyrimidine/phosphomethylpyrimidine kinase